MWNLLIESLWNQTFKDDIHIETWLRGWKEAKQSLISSYYLIVLCLCSSDDVSFILNKVIRLESPFQWISFLISSIVECSILLVRVICVERVCLGLVFYSHLIKRKVLSVAVWRRETCNNHWYTVSTQLKERCRRAPCAPSVKILTKI